MEGITSLGQTAVWVALAVALVGAAYALLLRGQVLAKETGNAEVQEVWDFLKVRGQMVRQGQIRTSAVVGILLSMVAAASVVVFPPVDSATHRFADSATLWIAAGRGGGLLVGGLVAALVGVFGTSIALESNARIAAIARKGYPFALHLGYQASSIPALLTVSLGLMGALLLLFLLGTAAFTSLLCFSIGTVAVALVFRLGGSIYTRAATHNGGDINEAEAAPGVSRTAALVADITRQDGAGPERCSPAATDLFERFDLSLIAALLTGYLLADGSAGTFLDGDYAMHFVLFPLLLRAVGVVAALVGALLVRTDEQRRNARVAISKGFYTAQGVAVVGSAIIALVFLQAPTDAQVDWRPFLALLPGVILSVGLERLVYLFTPIFANPYKKVNRRSVLAQLVMGCTPALWGVLAALLAFASAWLLYAGEPEPTRMVAILYGASLAGMGIFFSMGNAIAINHFAALTSNAHSIGKAAALEKNARNVLEDLAEVGTMTLGMARGNSLSITIIATIAILGSLFLSV